MPRISNEALRRLIARALASSDLSTSAITESAVDRVAAMAFADPLGAALWRLRLGHDAHSFKQAHALLAQRTKRMAPDPAIRLRLCETVLREWLDRNCRACMGRSARVNENGVMRPCRTCEGTGLRRYSDVWRMGQMRFDRRVYAKWESRFALAHDILTAADQAAHRQIAQQLGRVDAEIVAFPASGSDNRGSPAMEMAAA